jgi:hypothetical protein
LIIEDPWTQIALPEALLSLPEDSVQEMIVDRIRKFHSDSLWDTTSNEPLVASVGIAPHQIARIEAQQSTQLPGHYRSFLERWSHIEVFDGFRLLNPVGTPYVGRVDDLPGSSGIFFAIGDCFRRADGDTILLDIEHPATPVVVWCHDLRVIEPLAPTVGLALYRIMEYIAPEKDYDLSVGAVRKLVESYQLPWWRKIFRIFLG